MTRRTLLALAAGAVVRGSEGSVESAAIDHAAWDGLLKQYVTAESLVDYGRWQKDGTASLDAYLTRLAAAWPAGLLPTARRAAQINAYNALTVRWILAKYPVDSIWQTPHPFTEARHTLDGKKVSLDGIETELRRLGDPRIHGALVCASRSCPPLRMEAYDGRRLGEQLDSNVRAWMENPKLNQFDAEKKVARVSEIFKWYQDDFDAAPGNVPMFLAKYAAQWKPGMKLEYLPYNWGLNDLGGRGQKYSKTEFYWNYLKNKYR